MLREHSQFILGLLVLCDAIGIAVAWLGSYWLRFRLFESPRGVPELSDKFLPMLPVVVLAHLVIFYRLRLYRPRRDEGLFRETRDIFKAFIVAIVTIVMIDYLLPQSHKISRLFIATYAVVGSVCFVLFRALARLVLQALRRRGFNQRRAAIVGCGRNAQRLLHALRANTWVGLEGAYFLDDLEPGKPSVVRGLPVLGPLSDARRILEQNPIDAVFIALPTERAHLQNEVLHALETSLADVRLVPEILPAYAMRPNVATLDGVAILSLRQTPLYGWNAIAKRSFDLIVGAVCLLVAAGPMLLIAALIKLNSPGPVLYRQRRVGLDGVEFDLFKFRTMRPDAEAGTGPTWAAIDDPRRTPIGRFLRRTSLDELPNLFNVFRGEMSLVGPRPERPEFIEQFKEEIPRYMLRHKMKAGMTGFAQVRGLRGQTSLKKRIQHDVHYIKNWSLGLDVQIFIRTVVGVWFSRHET